MWGWLAETGNKSKRNWPGFNQIKSQPSNECFACEYVEKVAGDYNYSLDRCRLFCPIDWGSTEKGSVCEGEGSPYLEWWINCIKGGNIKQRREWAAKIRDLPWKDKSKE
jgi:hypothetical protein